MIRTQIQLPASQVATLKQLAERQQTSMAEIIRRAVDLYAAAPEAGAVVEQKKLAAAAGGRFHSGQSDISARHDDYLAEAFK